MAVTGLILAGGRGTRMGEVQKGLQPFHGKPLLSHAIARLGPQVDALAINANVQLETYAAFGLPVWPDLRHDFPGPTAGLEAGLAASPNEWIVTVPCDSPFLPMDLVARLRDAVARTNADLAYAVTDDGRERQPQPVFCLLRCSLLPALSAWLDAGERKLGAWQRNQHFAEAVFEDERAFHNINTLDELQRFEAQ